MRKQDNPQFLPALKGEVSLRSLMKRYENLKRICEDLAREAHKGQVTAIGADYFNAHIVPTVNKVDVLADKFPKVNIALAQCVAYLHDILEDTETTPDDLKDAGVTYEVIKAVEILTKRKKETYKDYISRIVGSHNALAQLVKYADLTVNLNTAYVNGIPESLIERYQNAICVFDCYNKNDYTNRLEYLRDMAIISRQDLTNMRNALKQSNKQGLVSGKNAFEVFYTIRRVEPEYHIWVNGGREALSAFVSLNVCLPANARNVTNKQRNLLNAIIAEYEKTKPVYDKVIKLYAAIK